MQLPALHGTDALRLRTAALRGLSIWLIGRREFVRGHIGDFLIQAFCNGAAAFCKGSWRGIRNER